MLIPKLYRAAASVVFALSALTVVSTAHAQSSRWTGFYAGVNIGGMTANDGLSISTSQSATGGLATGQSLGYFPLSNAPNGGIIGGVQGGYGRLLFDAFYVGAETDFQLLGAQTTVSSNPIVLGQQTPMSVTRSQTWLGTTRARVGFTPMPPC